MTMTKRLVAVLLVLAMVCSLVPMVFAAPSPTTTTNVTADLAYELKGLKFNSVLQNFHVESDYLYVTQSNGTGTVYLSRLKISGTTATYADHMTLNNCGNGETLSGYRYNGKLYFFVGSKGLEASDYKATQIARIQYEAGKTYTYTQLNRFTHLSNSTSDGTSLGTVNRVACDANDLFTVFRIQTSDDAITYSCYYTKALNQALDAGETAAMESATITGGFLYSFTQSTDNRVLPNNSFQGLALANYDAILVCGGNSGETPAISKMSSNGTYQVLANVTNLGTVSTGPIAIANGKVYIAYVPANSAYTDGQKIYAVAGTKIAVPAVSYVSGTLAYTLSGLKYTTAIQNFYIDSDYIYITQDGSNGTFYLSRLKINGTTATYTDHMTLNNCGTGEALAGYRYNNKLYFFIGAKGLESTGYHSTQVARIQYEAGKTYTYTDLNRFSHLSNMTASGEALGSSARVACGADENYTIIRNELDDGTTCYTCYDTKVLNKALDSGKLIAMESDAVRNGVVYHFKQKKATRILPNGSFQGVELAGLNNILLSGGNSGETPAVAKANKNGTYQNLAYITNIGTAATGPVEYLNDRLYIVATNTNKIYYIGGDKLGIAQTATTTYTANTEDILEAASYMKANMAAGVLPSTVTVGGKSCTNAQFLEMACKLLLGIADGSNPGTVSYRDVTAPSSPSGTATGTVSQAEYIAMARSILAEIESFRKAPNYTTTTIGKMQHSYCVYMVAFLLDYYVRNGMLPEAYAAMAWTGTTGSPLTPEVPGVTAFETASATTVHQLPCVVPDTETGDYQQSLSIVVRTADGKTIVFDGGRYGEDAEYLFKYLQRVTGDETPHVDAWFMTHAHSDHYGAFRDLVKAHGSQITLDAFYHRFPTDAEVDKYFSAVEPETRKNQISYIYNSVKSLKNAQGGTPAIITLNAIHTGKCNSTFDFGDLHIDVLLTFDDIMWAVDNISTKYTATWETHNADHVSQAPKQLVSENFNNSSTVFRLTMGGKTLMITGDAATVSTIMLEKYHKEHASNSAKYYSIKTDYVTMAHHGSRRGLSQSVYKTIDPDAVLWPVPKAGVTNAEKTKYPLQWINDLGATIYFSYAGPQAISFGTKRSATATTIPAELKPLVFNAEYYAENYPELKAAYGTDEAQLYNHFINYGIEEGRSASPYFDVRFYMNNNGEQLREHCHGDYNVAFAHFVQYVTNTTERQNNPKLLSPTFDCSYYGSAYADTKALTTELALLQHYATVGEAEGRLASQGFLSADGYTYHKKATRVVTEGTCSTAGSVKYTCSDCGYTCTQTASTTEHSYTETVTAPTCTDDGYTTYTCSICNHSYVEPGATATGHSYNETVTPPTCAADGKITYTCSVCGHSYEETGETATGHTYTYTKVDNRTHTVGCENCDLSNTESHTYENGTCVCGDVEIKEPVVDTSITINHTLNLASDISVNFAVKSSLLTDYVNHYMVVEIPVYKGNEQTGTRSVTLEPTENNGYYYYTLTGLTAVNMGDVVSAQLHMEKDGQSYLSKVDTYSVAQYAYSQLNKSNMPAALKTLCADLLRYGKEAQIYKNYRTDAPVDATMTDSHKAYLSDAEAVVFGSTNKTLTDLANPQITWAGKALSLDSKVCLKFIFSPGTYEGAVSGLTLRVSYKDTTGAEKTLTLTDAELYNADRGYYAFTLDTLLAAELRSVVSVQVYNGNTPVSCTLQYSADTYGNNKTGQLLTLCKALFAYSDSAKAYFAN